MNSLEAVQLIESNGFTLPDDKDEARTKFRELAKLVHPDIVDRALRKRAEKAFAKLSASYNGLLDPSFVTITTALHSYELGSLIVKGDIANLYGLTYDDKKTAVLKMARNPSNNDLILNEAAALKQIKSKGEEQYRVFVPSLIESYRNRDGLGAERAANVFEPLDGFYSLAQVLTAYPDGLDIRDVAWMWRRLLTVVGYSHKAGVAHGAITPEHVMIHPELHGLVLTDWCYSVIDFPKPLKAIVPSRKNLYAPEALDKKAVGRRSDLYTATKTIETLFSPSTPQAFRNFAKGCTFEKFSLRPTDAWKLLYELDGLLDRHFPRAYRAFSMPANT